MFFSDFSSQKTECLTEKKTKDQLVPTFPASARAESDGKTRRVGHATAVYQVRMRALFVGDSGMTPLGREVLEKLSPQVN